MENKHDHIQDPNSDFKDLLDSQHSHGQNHDQILYVCQQQVSQCDYTSMTESSNLLSEDDGDIASPALSSPAHHQNSDLHLELGHYFQGENIVHSDVNGPNKDHESLYSK